MPTASSLPRLVVVACLLLPHSLLAATDNSDGNDAMDAAVVAAAEPESVSSDESAPVCTDVLAQRPADRPVVGLVLSGGGARGLAHVGVLQVLEEMKIPVDCVVGTSMGALVGGTYAAGVRPGKMREVLDKNDIGLLFDDLPPRADIPQTVRRDDYRPLFRDARVRDDFNAGLRHLKATGRFRQIYERYLRE